MFERSPFHTCPQCKASSAFGILSARGNTLNRRCKECRYRHEARELKLLFEASGVSSTESGAEVRTFWEWPGNLSLPEHRLSSYLFAAIARKLASGQKRLPSRGMSNDITVISTYGPYVDAMFLDNECAALLSESPLNTELKLKAKIFSTNSGDAFLGYLQSIEAETSSEVRAYAEEIYGLSYA